jgi:hypothetical protein
MSFILVPCLVSGSITKIQVLTLNLSGEGSLNPILTLKSNSESYVEIKKD